VRKQRGAGVRARSCSGEAHACAWQEIVGEKPLNTDAVMRRPARSDRTDTSEGGRDK